MNRLPAPPPADLAASVGPSSAAVAHPLTSTPPTASGGSGHVTSSSIGNGMVTTSASYNPRSEISLLSYNTTPATVWSKQYTWTPNGNLQQATDPINNTTRKYGYDALNRLTSALDVITGTSNPAPNGLTENFTYDAFGNLWQSGNFTFWPTQYTNGNEPYGATYDATGNLVNDGVGNTFTWDEEGRVSTANGVTYSYNAGGDRVGKSGSGATDSIYFAGRPVARLSGGAWTNLIYGGSALLAEVPSTNPGTPVYRLTDHLGSSVATITSPTPPFNIQDYAPFGQLFNGSSSNDPYKFTGKERDAESGNDYFGARYYASSMGRFLSPDPSGLLAQHPENPQSWNLYAYARNNPLKFLDPSGLDCVYANDAGNGVESIDHNSNAGECGDNGGSWAPGYVDENWANYNQKTGMFQVGSVNGSGANATVDYTKFAAGEQTLWSEDESSCIAGCSGFGSANANWLQGQLVGNSMLGGLDGYIQFLTGRVDPIHGMLGASDPGLGMQMLSGPLDFRHDNWAGPAGMGVPGGRGDWAASMHDYNFNTNGITLGTYFNPTISPATAKALIQSDNNLIRNAGGFQSIKMGLFFGVVNAFQWGAHAF